VCGKGVVGVKATRSHAGASKGEQTHKKPGKGLALPAPGQRKEEKRKGFGIIFFFFQFPLLRSWL